MSLKVTQKLEGIWLTCFLYVINIPFLSYSDARVFMHWVEPISRPYVITPERLLGIHGRMASRVLFRDMSRSAEIRRWEELGNSTSWQLMSVDLAHSSSRVPGVSSGRQFCGWIWDTRRTAQNLTLIDMRNSKNRNLFNVLFTTRTNTPHDSPISASGYCACRSFRLLHQFLKSPRFQVDHVLVIFLMGADETRRYAALMWKNAAFAPSLETGFRTSTSAM